ncbi:hypothetical protein ACYULU_11255 [Breznakiellaceae bacterium SP9]
MMKVLLDTNGVIDWLTPRMPFAIEDILPYSKTVSSPIVCMRTVL